MEVVKCKLQHSLRPDIFPKKKISLIGFEKRLSDQIDNAVHIYLFFD